jgi:murein L,D-transpeptidase YcbB/YkuD
MRTKRTFLPWKSLRQALGLALLVASLGSLAACGESQTAAIPSPGLFTPRVELDLPSYLQGLSSPPLGLPDPRERELARHVRAFYAARQHAPAWFADGKLQPAAEELVAMLAGLDDEGLVPGDYRVPALTAAMQRAADGDLAPGGGEELEVGLTWAALLAASHLRHGRLTPEEMGDRWRMRREPVDLPAVLAEALASGEVAETLRRLDPDHPQFVGLLAELRRYREIAARGGWPTVPTGPVLSAGERGDRARLVALARRLQAEGFLAEVPAELAGAAGAPRAGEGGENAGAAAQAVYGEELAAAVRRFQHTRTLAEDGSLGEETQAELNVSIADRLRQIALNVERWRWVPDDLGRDVVLVNIPGYTLDVEQDRRIVQSMAVVVGEEGWETPVFADEIEYLVVNPYWNVPPGILEEEVLPAVRADRGYLAAHDMEVVRGFGEDPAPAGVGALLAGEGEVRVRQRPGAENPLGRIKFMFPNDDDIYLHDTPAGDLFQQPDRSASHGCIRVERPLELADWLLRGSREWDAQRLRAAIESGKTEDVALPRKTPVYLLYFTAAVRPDGRLELYEDIYGLDAAHARALGTQVATATGGGSP